MKKKQIRIIVIAAMVLIFLGLGLARLKIEPADGGGTPQPKEGSSAAAEEDQPESAPDSGQPEQPTAAGQPKQPEPDLPAAQPEPPEQPAAAEQPEPPEQPAAAEQPEQTEQPAAEQPEPLPGTEQPEPPAQPAGAPEEPAIHTCTLEIRCDTVVDTSKLENEAVIPYIPASGVILAETEVEYTPGENVFEVLKRVTRDQGIQMEFREDALYSGAYIEGINYLYEFDGGTLSGWMYKVNGQFPNYGCSQYFVEDGDEIVWMYTCDLGRDVGDNSTW